MYQCVSPGDIDALVTREGDHVGETFVPADFVDERLVECVLARIGMHPASLRARVDFAPHVIGPVEHVARVHVESARTQTEAVGPLAASARARLEQLARMIEACESSRALARLTSNNNRIASTLIITYKT